MKVGGDLAVAGDDEPGAEPAAISISTTDGVALSAILSG
jgi:hypothetical protein